MADNNNNQKTPRRFSPPGSILCGVRGGVPYPGAGAADADTVLRRLNLQQCPDCHKTFGLNDKEEIYLHWEGKHRKYDEEENPLPSPSDG